MMAGEQCDGLWGINIVRSDILKLIAVTGGFYGTSAWFLAVRAPVSWRSLGDQCGDDSGTLM